MVFFNIAAFLVAATGFFPNSLYGDAVYEDLNDPDSLLAPEEVLNRIMLNSNQEIVEIIPGFRLTFGVLMASIVIITIAIGALTRSTIPITMGLLSTMFLFMYTNSKNVFDRMLDNFDSSVGYIGLMLGVGFFIALIIAIMDYAGGQNN